MVPMKGRPGLQASPRTGAPVQQSRRCPPEPTLACGKRAPLAPKVNCPRLGPLHRDPPHPGQVPGQGPRRIKGRRGLLGEKQALGPSVTGGQVGEQGFLRGRKGPTQRAPRTIPSPTQPR